MKKYIIVLAVLVGFSAQAKLPKKLLAEMHKSISLSCAHLSPLVGAVQVLNGDIARKLAQKDLLTNCFFHRVGDGPVELTTAKGYVAIGLTPALLGTILKLHVSGDLYKPEFLKSAVFVEWFNNYWDKAYKARTDLSCEQEDSLDSQFKGDVKALLAKMQKASQQSVTELLLSAVYLVGNTQADLELFLQNAAIPLDQPGSDAEKAIMKEYADCFLSLCSDGSYGFLNVPELYELQAYCSEKALWTVINWLLYDEDQQKLSVAMLPEEIRKTVCVPLREFIEKNDAVSKPEYYKATWQNFIKGVVHRHLTPADCHDGPRDRTELGTTADVNLRVINKLFGLQAKNFTEFFRKVTTEKNRITVNESKIHQKFGTGPLCLTVAQQGKPVMEITWSFNNGHAFSESRSLLKQSGRSFRPEDAREVASLDDHLKTETKLVCCIPGYLHHLIDWQTGTVQDVEQILEKYGITNERLAELTKGLRGSRCTLFHTAMQQCRIDIMQLLHQRNGDLVGQLDSNGEGFREWIVVSCNRPTVVHMRNGVAVTEEWKGKDFAVFIKEIVDDPFFGPLFLQKNENGWGILHHCIKSNRLSIFEEVARVVGAEYLDCVDKSDKTLLYYALQKRTYENNPWYYQAFLRSSITDFSYANAVYCSLKAQATTDDKEVKKREQQIFIQVCADFLSKFRNEKNIVDSKALESYREKLKDVLRLAYLENDQWTINALEEVCTITL